MKPKMTSVRVLLVDDFEPIRRLIPTILRTPTFEIIGEASNGLEAVQKATELQPDLILLDIGLPQLNGIEVAKRISEVAPYSKILFVSQETSFEVVEVALSLGGYVSKSCIQTDLLPAIESVQRFIGGGLELGDLTDKGKAQAPNRPMPYHFGFDSTNSILQVHLDGFIGAQDVRNCYQSAVKHVAGLSPRSYIVDVSAVTSTTVSSGAIREIGKLPPVLPPQFSSFIVASRNAAFWLMSMVALVGKVTRPNLHVVRNHAAVWAILGIREPRFKRLPDHVDGQAVSSL